MPLTEEQQKARASLRAALGNLQYPFGTAESVDQRARYPDPAHLPSDVTVHIEIAPPSAHPHPLLDTGALKTPERVPVYFYALQNDHAKSEAANTRVIFFIHGGGNVTGHPTEQTFIQFYAQLLRTSALHSGDANKCVLIAPSYRLATVPENTFPAALQDLVAAYDYVLGKGYKASNIVIAGDSAGASHAVVLTHLVLQSGRPPPHGVIPIAPKGHGRLSELAQANANTDILTIPLLEIFSRRYVGDSGIQPADSLISSASIPFAATWPKTLILVGSGDLLIDGSRDLAKRLSALGLVVELVEYDERPHGWWVMPHAFAEDIQDAAQRIVQFIL